MIFDYSKFDDQVNHIAPGYNNLKPYPYAIFDDLFNNSIIREVNEEIDLAQFEIDERQIKGEEVKIRSDFEDNESLPAATRKIFELLNGGRFLNLVSRLTGINGLIPDPYYDGGGINIIKDQGTLAVHIDGTNQQRMAVSRRINAILFLNEDWNPDWNGYHEQWEFVNKDLSPFDENQEWRCVRKVLPKKNRLYIFTTNDHSWHGHAGLLNVPNGVERRSLISYYYTSTRPETDLIYEAPHRALFINNDITLSTKAFADTEIIL